MFCEKCGAQMDNDSKFCLNCGAPATPQAVPVAVSAAPAASSFFNKKNILILGIVAAVIIVGIVIASLPTTIYIDDYITIEYQGLSTQGYAYLNFNDEAFEAALLEEMTQRKMHTMIARMSDSILELDKTSELTNGDEIHISFYMDNEIAKDYGVQFKLKNDTVTVSALREPVFLDLFADIELTFNGCSPCSQVTFVNNSTNEFIQDHVRYHIGNSSDLEEGEPFTIYAFFPEDSAEEAGYIILESSKEYTATNLPQPIELDPFDYVTVTFSGLEGSGSAGYQIIGDIDFIMNYVTFGFDKFDLSEGETVTLAYNIRRNANPLKYGYKFPEETTKQYTVSKLGQYITDFAQLTESGRASAIAGALEEAKYHLTKEGTYNNTSAIKLYNTGHENLNSLSLATDLSNVKLHSVVYAYDQNSYSPTNRLYFIFTVDITGHCNITGGNSTGYFCLYIENPIMKGDGTLEFDFVNRDLNYERYCYLSYEALKYHQFGYCDVLIPYIPEA